MKKLLFITVLAAFIMTACTSGGGEGDAAAVAEHNSEYYNDIIFAEGGEMLGLNLGDSKADVKAALPADAFDDETDSYMYYYWALDNNDYYLDLYFENGQLSSIDGYVYFYDAESYYDKAAAKAFYQDLKEDFTDAYGAEEEEVDGEYVYTYWYFDDKDVEVGMDEGEVYWYIYSYEDYSSSVEEVIEDMEEIVEEVVEEV